MDMTRRVLLIGLRTLADELEAGRLDPDEVLGAIAPEPERTLPAEPPAAAQGRPQRPAKVGAKRKKPRATKPPTERTEAQELIERLREAHGELRQIAERFGFSAAVLTRWANGAPCSPASLERLREATSAGAFRP